MKTFTSDLSHKSFPAAERVCGNVISPSILTVIQKENPEFQRDKFLAVSELNVYRAKYISNYLLKESEDLTELERKVLATLQDRDSLVSSIEVEVPLTRGQKIADSVATFGGSWRFIISFGAFIFLWISFNVYAFRAQFDPFPFILLNLILSCLAALQAPVIMMSQNRQEEKDRDRGKKDYMINLKSELEIRMLHEKIDHLIMDQQQELLSIQKMQVDMMSEILEKLKGGKGN
jgi:uncharacterized membrane protein